MGGLYKLPSRTTWLLYGFEFTVVSSCCFGFSSWTLVDSCPFECKFYAYFGKVSLIACDFFRLRKSDLTAKNRKLRHEGVLYWRNAREKEVETLVVVLSDVLLFLQENDKKYSFFTQDNKVCLLSTHFCCTTVLTAACRLLLVTNVL